MKFGSYVDTVQMYDADIRAWKFGTSLPYAARFASCGTIDSQRIICTGGEKGKPDDQLPIFELWRTLSSEFEEIKFVDPFGGLESCKIVNDAFI